MRRARFGALAERFLEDRCRVRVRFQEVDSLRVVWHGHYLSYFEEGRESFGARFGLGYQGILDAGYIAPLVHVELDYLRPARYGQTLVVRTRLHWDDGARIQFAYRITDDEDAELVTGRTVQVFTDLDGEIVLTRPALLDRVWERSP